jgi:GTPase SAR1 family protein
MTDEVDGPKAQLSILDTCGQEEFSAMRAQWIRDAELLILCSSFDRAESLEGVKELYQQVQRVKVVPRVFCAGGGV